MTRASKFFSADLAQQSALRNAIINGGMSFARRGTSGNPVANAVSYQLDRWETFQVGGANGDMTVSQQAGDALSPHCMRVLRNVAATITDSRTKQVIEMRMGQHLAGRTVTLSYRARKGAGFTAASSNLAVLLQTGTGAVDQGAAAFEAGTVTGQTAPVSVNDVLTTTFQTFSHKVLLPSNVTQISLSFNPLWVGAAPANDYFEFTDVNLHVGNIATPFVPRPMALELLLCQRYYQSSFPQGVAPANNAGVTGAFTVGAQQAGALRSRAGFSFIATMRATPSAITCFNPSAANGEMRDATAAADCSSTAISASGDSNFRITCLGNAASAIANNLQFHWSAEAEL